MEERIYCKLLIISFLNNFRIIQAIDVVFGYLQEPHTIEL